jgi:phage putative tail component, N-terminal domain
MPVSFTFNGVKKDYLRVLVGLERPAWTPIEEEILEIPGRPGGIITKQHTTVRRLNIPVRVYKRGFNSLEELEEDLAAWLVTDEPKPLEFDHKPNRVYYAKVTGELIFTEYPQWADGVISFLCPDPYKYGPEQYTEFESSATFRVDGTVETKPIIEIRMKDKSTFVAVSNGERLNMIGNYASVDQPPFEPTTLVLHDGMGSMVGWTSTTSIEEGENTGSIATSGDSFYAADFGVGSQWHGPALKRSIGEALQDFELEAEISFDGEKGQVGSIEIALLDVNNQFVAKLLFTKRVSERLKTTSGCRWDRMMSVYAT